MGKTRIERAPNAGFCFGVKRAIELAEETAANYKDRPIYTLGPIIHNPQVVEQLQAKGIVPITEPADMPPGVLIIRSHGAQRGLIEQAQSAGHHIVDATCPFVKRAQELAQHLSKEGYQVVIIGEASHPEVKGLLSYAHNTASKHTQHGSGTRSCTSETGSGRPGHRYHRLDHRRTGRPDYRFGRRQTSVWHIALM